MLIIESMDDDTETRRLSPLALLGDGYVDLINGPQDHGWCSGYTCRLRLSTFMALVATGKNNYDTETRQLSPLVLLGDGYVDLINGPQDHGWCSGYTCRLRLSTFMALVATG